MSLTTLTESILLYPYWQSQLPDLRKRYSTAEPYPHVVLENFLNPNTLEKALGEFPDLGSGKWIHYIHANERKYGKTDASDLGPTLAAIIRELNSPAFVQFLSNLTGIEGLFADESLEGGGLHQSPRGGFLNVHADFTVHPHHRDWRRRINVLVYLNKDWRDSYGGHLELWDKKMKRCVHKVAPLLNRAVIFNTRPNSFHGHPEPLTCPEGMTRKSIALYYFTKNNSPFIQSTEYRARPGEGPKRIGIYLDKMLLRAYDAVKRTFNLDDEFASRVLKQIDKFKQRFK